MSRSRSSFRKAFASAPAEAMEQKVNLLDLDRKALEAFFEGLGAKSFHGRNVLKWIHKHGVTDFEGMTDLSKKLRRQLGAGARLW